MEQQQQQQQQHYEYKDLEGNIQGPFPLDHLRAWNRDGYLSRELEVRLVSSSSSSAITTLGRVLDKEEVKEEVKELKLRAAKLKLLLAVVVVPANMRLRASSLPATKALRVVIVKSLSSVSRRRARRENKRGGLF